MHVHMVTFHPSPESPLQGPKLILMRPLRATVTLRVLIRLQSQQITAAESVCWSIQITDLNILVSAILTVVQRA